MNEEIALLHPRARWDLDFHRHRPTTLVVLNRLPAFVALCEFLASGPVRHGVVHLKIDLVDIGGDLDFPYTEHPGGAGDGVCECIPSNAPLDALVAEVVALRPTLLAGVACGFPAI